MKHLSLEQVLLLIKLPSPIFASAAKNLLNHERYQIIEPKQKKIRKLQKRKTQHIAK